MGFSRAQRLLAATLSGALALGLVVDIVDEYATEAPAMALIAERPPITSPQLDGVLFVMDSSVAAPAAAPTHAVPAAATAPSATPQPPAENTPAAVN